MKLASILNHIPASQNVLLQDHLKTIAEGNPADKKIKQFSSKTVGLIYTTEDGKILINVYDR